MLLLFYCRRANKHADRIPLRAKPVLGMKSLLSHSSQVPLPLPAALLGTRICSIFPVALPSNAASSPPGYGCDIALSLCLHRTPVTSPYFHYIGRVL